MLFFLAFSGCLGRAQSTPNEQVPANKTHNPLSDVLLERAENEVTRIKTLVDQGVLPKSRLKEAELALADAQDEAILSETLYGEPRVEDMSPAQSKAMVDAAQRRVDRQHEILEDRKKLLDTGILAGSEFAAFKDELASRERVLHLALNRAKLVKDLREMAAREQQLERARNAAAIRFAIIRYDGSGNFNLNDMTTISREFEQRFHHALPVSALGQTLVHQSMGLDHRNRVDIALNPDAPEGIWLRQLLERLHVPYLAFRTAVTGAATAPHIHIGPESTRLKLAAR
ncbi:MAG: hypothetical protein JOY62_02650 [Acidobacteriaceae bacterium]|nr:hypothetical protein [Acidobacteriaceae bacterium]MBV9778850.1 hypothetical protein [Acidobacteriaceae bacterium]